MVKVLIILLSFLFICNESRYIIFHRRHKVIVYIDQRNPAPNFNPSLFENTTYITTTPTEIYTRTGTASSTTTTTVTEIDTSEARESTSDVTTSETTTDTSTFTNEENTISVKSDATSVTPTSISVTSDSDTSSLSTIYETTSDDDQTTSKIPSTILVSSDVFVSLSTEYISQTSVEEVSDSLSTTSVTKSTSGPDERSTFEQAIVDGSGSGYGDDEDFTKESTVISSSLSTAYEISVEVSDSSSPTSLTTSTSGPYEPAIVDGSGSGYGDDEDFYKKSTVTSSSLPTADETGSGSDEGSDFDTTHKFSTDVAVATTPNSNQENTNREHSRDDNLSEDDGGSGFDVMPDSSDNSKKNWRGSESSDSDFIFDETEKAANPDLFRIFAGSSLPPEKNYGPELILESTINENKKRVALPVMFRSETTTTITKLPTVFKESGQTILDFVTSNLFGKPISTPKPLNKESDVDDLKEATDFSATVTFTESTTTLATSLTPAKNYTFDVTNDLSVKESSLPSNISTVAMKQETKMEDKINDFTETTITHSSSNNENSSVVFITPKSSLEIFKITNSYGDNLSASVQDNKERYDVIANDILELERGNLDEDYYIIVDGYDYSQKPLNKSKISHSQIDRNDTAVGNSTGIDFENRKNNTDY